MDYATQHFRRWLNHLEWADGRTAEALVRSGGQPARAMEIFAHLLGSEEAWFSRIVDREPSVAIWPTLTPEECAALAEKNAERLRDLLDEAGTEGLERKVAYTNSAGDAFTSSVAEILSHVCLHGAYHRGQVALLLRSAGLEPVPTGFIGYARGAPAAKRRDGSG